MICATCLSDKKIITLKSKKKIIRLCDRCFNHKNRGEKLIKGHGYNKTPLPIEEKTK